MQTAKKNSPSKNSPQLLQLTGVQGRSQDFFRGTHNSPNHFAPPPPPKKKTFLDLRFGYVVSLTVFFCI